jgi:L-aspartate oxidase
MSRGAGVLRSADSLIETSNALSRLEARHSDAPQVDAWETTNLFQLAQTILRAALIRQETRGSHWREDFPETSVSWEKRIVQQIDDVGSWATEYAQVINK